VLAYYTAARWISSAFRYSPSHMLGKYFLRCWPLTATGNLTPSNSSSMYAFPGKTWSTLYGPCQVGDHLPNFLSLVPNGNTASQTKSPTRKSLGLTFLLYAWATLALFSLIFSSDQSLSYVRSSTLSFIKAAYCSADRSFWNSTRLDPAVISHGSTASWP